MNLHSACPFCSIDYESQVEKIIAKNEHAVLMLDGFPVSKGHSLVLAKRHIVSFFETSQQEKIAMLELLDRAKSYIDMRFKPDAYNIGINDGPAAGQTVPHLHIHIIPRYKGDNLDPRGGVRCVIPEKTIY
jgi:diadenosine tetraphosphate (Ap4A) HIT family hydrolase